MSDSPLRFAEYIDRVMMDDNWSGDRPQIGELAWADKVIAYIEWLRENAFD